MKNRLILTIASFVVLASCSNISETLSTYSFSNYTSLSESFTSEVFICEDFNYEDFTNETILQETILYEKIRLQNLIGSRAEIDNFDIAIFPADSSQNVLENYVSPDVQEYNVDWGRILGNYAIGTGVILITFTLGATLTATGNPLGAAFTTSFTSSWQSAVGGMIVSMSTFLPEIITKYMNNEPFDESVYQAIDAGSSGFMIGAVTGALFGLTYGLFELTDNPIIYDQAGKVIGVIDSSLKYILNNNVEFYEIINPINLASLATVYAIATNMKIESSGVIVDVIFVVFNIATETFGILNQSGVMLDETETSRILLTEKLATVNKAWLEEQQLVQNTGIGTRVWSQSEKQQLLTNGKVDGYFGYSGKSLSLYPQYVNNSDNIYFLRFDERLNLFVTEDNCVIWETLTNWPLLNRNSSLQMNLA